MKAFIVCLVACLALVNAQSTWVKMTDLPGVARDSSNGISVTYQGTNYLVVAGGYSDTDLSAHNEVFRSTNGGVSWTTISSPGFEPRWDHALIPGTTAGSILLVGGVNSNHGFFDSWLSTDAGATWTRTNANAGFLPNIFQGNSWTVPVNGVATAVLVGGPSALGTSYNLVYRSSNNGATWTQFTGQFAPRIGHTVSAASNTNVLVLTGGNVAGQTTSISNDIWTSADGGQTWVSRGNGPFATRWGHAAAATATANYILGGASGQNAYLNDVWVSTNDGVTWSQVTPAAQWQGRWLHFSVAHTNGKLYVMTGTPASQIDLVDVWSSDIGVVTTYSWNTPAFDQATCVNTVTGGTCGSPAQMTRTVTCIASPGNTVVSDQTCIDNGAGTKPLTTNSCVLPACATYNWFQSGCAANTCTQGGLSCATTGTTGTCTQTVTCRDQNSQTVADSLCTATKPSTSVVCALASCYTWFSNNALCSTTCSTPAGQLCGTTGVCQNTIQCRDNQNVVQSNTNLCTATRPANSQVSCALSSCVYSWVATGSYQGCVLSAGQTCGTGTDSRTVACRDQNGFTVADSFCDASLRASVATRSCSVACQVTYSYSYTSYSACSATCGGGVSTRIAYCFDSNGGQVANTFCTAALGQPVLTSVPCNTGSCITSYSWSVSSFSTCSAQCGTGFSSRSVTCIDNLGGTQPDSACIATLGSKPATVQLCNTSPCATCAYQAAAWTTCSNPCNGGVQSRIVQCLDQFGATCASCSGAVPATSQVCNTQVCSRVVGDPEFTGFLGQKFEVHGIPQQYFNLITSPLLQYNAQFVYIGARSSYANQCEVRTHKWTHAGTYLGQLGIKTGADRIELEAGSCLEGIKSVKVNGEALAIGERKVLAKVAGRADMVQMIYYKNAFEVVLNLAEVDIKLFNSDMFFNQDVQLTTYGRFKLQTHGLLGQTWRDAVYTSPEGGKVVYEGAITDYLIQEEDVFGDDFEFNRFVDPRTQQ